MIYIKILTFLHCQMSDAVPLVELLPTENLFDLSFLTIVYQPLEHLQALTPVNFAASVVDLPMA